MGSFARGDAGTYSDIDLVRFRHVDGVDYSAETHLIDQMFVVTSDVTPSQVNEWFVHPDKASSCIAGVRTARPLWDPSSYFAEIQARARSFAWDESMQAKANAWASEQMVGWIEEAQKGLEGIRRHDTGRMLNARYQRPCPGASPIALQCSNARRYAMRAPTSGTSPGRGRRIPWSRLTMGAAKSGQGLQHSRRCAHMNTTSQLGFELHVLHGSHFDLKLATSRQVTLNPLS
jgi:hypothetical protein